MLTPYGVITGTQVVVEDGRGDIEDANAFNYPMVAVGRENTEDTRAGGDEGKGNIRLRESIL